MSRRGRRPHGVKHWLDRFRAIADLHEQGLGTTEIQSRLGIQRSTVSAIRGVLRAAEERGYARASREAEAASERAVEPFSKSSQPERADCEVAS